MDTNAITNAYTAQATAESASASKAKNTSKVTKPAGQKEVGSPQLSEKAQKYYNQLRKKFSNMDFILVSSDKKEEVQANASKYAGNSALVVLIDEDKIEKMAEDEAYRAKYEGILRGATTQMAQMKQSLGKNADSVKTIGMSFNEKGVASFFAVVDKSLASQKKRIEKKAEQKAEDKKKAERKAEQKRAEEKRKDGVEKTGGDSEDTVTVTASSWDELLKKINDTSTMARADSLRTEQETWVGQRFDSAI